MRGEESLIPEATDAAKLLDMLHTHTKSFALGLGSKIHKNG